MIYGYSPSAISVLTTYFYPSVPYTTISNIFAYPVTLSSALNIFWTPGILVMEVVDVIISSILYYLIYCSDNLTLTVSSVFVVISL